MASKLQDAVWRAIEAVNKLVECDETPFNDRHDAIEHVRKHLEARAQQVRGRATLVELLGEWAE